MTVSKTISKIGTLYTNANVNEKYQGGIRILKKKNFIKNLPIISIVTVTFNSARTLEETIKSVINQSYNNFEYIIIDGQSSDNTLNIINKYDKYIDYWFSEKDLGIYDAFNKGLDYFSGDFVGFVNSDDILEKDALKILSEYIKNYPEKDFFFGSVKKHWGVLHGYKKWKVYYSWGFYSSHSCGFYIKKNAARKNGYYNQSFRWHADYDYFYRMIIKNKLEGKGTRKNELFGHFRRGGFSSKINFNDHVYETAQIRLNNNQNKYFVAIITLIKIYFNYQRINNPKKEILNILKFILKFKN